MTDGVKVVGLVSDAETSAPIPGAEVHLWPNRHKRAVSAGSRSEVTLVLRVGPVISGRVVDGTGQPLEGVLGRALPRRGSDVLQSFCGRPPCPRVAVTNAHGVFRVEGLWKLGDVSALRAKKPGHDYPWVRNVKAGRADVLVTLPALKPLEGRVVLGATGEPALEFQVKVSPILAPGKTTTSRPVWLPRSRGLITDPDGRFTVARAPPSCLVPPGRKDGRGARNRGRVVARPGGLRRRKPQAFPGWTVRATARIRPAGRPEGGGRRGPAAGVAPR